MDEHKAMLECEHREADQMVFCCLFCGRLNLPDWSWVVVFLGFGMIGANLYWWWAL